MVDLKEYADALRIEQEDERERYKAARDMPLRVALQNSLAIGYLEVVSVEESRETGDCTYVTLTNKNSDDWIKSLIKVGAPIMFREQLGTTYGGFNENAAVVLQERRLRTERPCIKLMLTGKHEINFRMACIVESININVLDTMKQALNLARYPNPNQAGAV